MVRATYMMKSHGIFSPSHGCFVIFLLVLSSNMCNPLHTLEQAVREPLLRPRNFNPHPYQSYHTQSDRLFDGINIVNSGAESYVDNSLFTLNGLGRTLENPLPARHPSNGLFSQAPHQFPPTLPPSQNARNLNSQPFVTLKYKNDISQGNDRPATTVSEEMLFAVPKKQYAFSYTVHDKQSGDDFSHTQQQKNGAVQGTYKVQLPDGRTQVVRYTADNDGYRADVSYIIEKNSIEPDHIQHSHPHPHPPPSPHHHYHHPQHQAVENDYASYVANTPEQQEYHQLNSYNAIYDASSVQSLAQSIPATSSGAAVFFSTAQPPAAIDTDANFYGKNPLTLEQRKSISARPTYVVSSKSTQITDTHHDHSLYYKPAHHHTVFYKTP